MTRGESIPLPTVRIQTLNVPCQRQPMKHQIEPHFAAPESFRDDLRPQLTRLRRDEQTPGATAMLQDVRRRKQRVTTRNELPHLPQKLPQYGLNCVAKLLLQNMSHLIQTKMHPTWQIPAATSMMLFEQCPELTPKLPGD